MNRRGKNQGRPCSLASEAKVRAITSSCLIRTPNWGAPRNSNRTRVSEREPINSASRPYSKAKLAPNCYCVRTLWGLCIMVWPSLVQGARNWGQQICTSRKPCSYPRDLRLLTSNKESVSRGLDCDNSDCYLLDDSRTKLNIHVLVFQLNERTKVAWMRNFVN